MRQPESTAISRNDTMTWVGLKMVLDSSGLLKHLFQILRISGHNSRSSMATVSTIIWCCAERNIILVKLVIQPTSHNRLEGLYSNHLDIHVVGIRKSTTGATIGHAQFLRVFAEPWDYSMTSSLLKNKFKAKGIFPFDPHTIPDETLTLSEVNIKQYASAHPPVDEISLSVTAVDDKNQRMQRQTIS